MGPSGPWFITRRWYGIVRGSAMECVSNQDVIAATDGFGDKQHGELTRTLKRIVSMLTRRIARADAVFESSAQYNADDEYEKEKQPEPIMTRKDAAQLFSETMSTARPRRIQTTSAGSHETTHFESWSHFADCNHHGRNLNVGFLDLPARDTGGISRNRRERHPGPSVEVSISAE